MNDIKREFRWFSIMDYEKEANYLSKRHQQGWKFHEAAFPGIYTFHKCEPENVVYQLDYNNAVKKNQREYVQMFEDCGWEYVQNFNGYCYFRKPMAQMQQKEENHLEKYKITKPSHIYLIREGLSEVILSYFMIYFCSASFRFNS